MSTSTTAVSEASSLWPDVRPETARRLMLAGVEAFAARGYHATTTRDIATAAGMSPAALYVYFPSKVALLFAISRSGHEQALAMLQEAVASEDDPVRAVRRMVEEFVAWHARRHTVARVVEYELQALPEHEYQVVAELRRRIEALIRQTITSGMRSGPLEDTDVWTAARVVTSLGIDVARWYTDHSSTSPATLGRRYADLVLRMLGAPLGT